MKGAERQNVVELHIPAQDKERMERLQSLLRSVDTENPDPRKLAAVRAMIDEAPDLWRKAFNLTEISIAKVVETAVSGVLGQQLLQRDVRDLVARMGGAEAAPMEQTLINHVAFCWLRLQTTELRYTSVTRDGELSIKQADHWERRLTQAQKRYLRACESLARVRRLALPPRPPVQLNIGGQQVNVAPGAASVSTT